MKKFVAVIGGERSGKSTLIQSLTGCPTRSWREPVIDLVTQEKIYVIASSPQEKELLDFDDILHKVVQDDSIIGLVVAIQPTHPRTHLSMEDIFQQVQNSHAFSTFAVIINPPYNGDPVDTTDIRTRLRKIGVAPHQEIEIDGRRFAHLNACVVQNFVGLP